MKQICTKGMREHKAPDGFRLMRREIVSDDVSLAALPGHDLAYEVDKRRSGVARHRVSSTSPDWVLQRKRAQPIDSAWMAVFSSTAHTAG